MKSLLSCAVATVVLSVASAATAGQSQPTLAAPGYEVAPPVAEYHAGPVYAAPSRSLYTNVKVRDRRNIAPCAIPCVVSVADPCADGCCVDVEICVPNTPCPPEVRESCNGRKVTYDYGEYQVDIRSTRRGIIVDYDD